MSLFKCLHVVKLSEGKNRGNLSEPDFKDISPRVPVHIYQPKTI